MCGFCAFSFFFFLSFSYGDSISGVSVVDGCVSSVKLGGDLNAHSLGLRGGTASDLLNTELVQFDLQLFQLIGEVILALSPELTSLDLR